jgi:hypothetical protein
MTSISTTPAPTTPAAPAQPGDNVTGNGGVQGAVADLLRGAGAGYAKAAKMESIQSDKAAIVPFETIMTGTSLLKDKTAHIKGVGRATGLLNTIAGFGLLIVSANTSGTLSAPGATAQDLGNHVADMIDGKDTANGWNLGWGVVAGEKEESSSMVGDALTNLGMR